MDFLDHFESMENAAEREYASRSEPDGMFRCTCGNIFDTAKEGGLVGPYNPYSMPVCEKCFQKDLENWRNP